MNIKSNENIAELLEKIYESRYKKFNNVFRAFKDQNSASLKDFQEKQLKIFQLKSGKGSIATQSEALWLLYTWFKYRVIYKITYIDDSVTKISNNVSKDIKAPLFFDSFFMLYDFIDSKYIGTFVSIGSNIISFGFLYKDNDDWNIEPLTINIPSSPKPVYVCAKDYLKNKNVKSLKHSIDTPYFRELIKNAEIVIQVIRAIKNSYENKGGYNHKKSIPSSQLNLDKITTMTLEVTRNQVIVVGNNKSNLKHTYQFQPYIQTGTPKSPHPRRAYTRRISVKNSNGEIIGTKEVKVKATIVHKDRYSKVTTKIVK